MTDTDVIHLGLQTMLLAAELGGPILGVCLVVGFVISLFQSVTSIQEPTLSFVPKVIGVAAVLLLGGHWMLGQLIAFCQQLFGELPGLLR